MANFEFLATFDVFWAAHREMPEKSIDRSTPFSEQYAQIIDHIFKFITILF